MHGSTLSVPNYPVRRSPKPSVTIPQKTVGLGTPEKRRVGASIIENWHVAEIEVAPLQHQATWNVPDIEVVG